MGDDGAFWNAMLVFVLRFVYNEFKLFKKAALLCNGKRCKDIVYKFSKHKFFK